MFHQKKQLLPTSLRHIANRNSGSTYSLKLTCISIALLVIESIWLSCKNQESITGPETPAPPEGMALRLDGDGDYVEITNPNGLNFGDTTSFTIEMWFKMDTLKPVNIINKSRYRSEANNFRGWLIDIDRARGSYSFVWEFGYEHSSVDVSGFRSHLTAKPIEIQTDIFYHLAITVNRALNQTIKYLNGDAINHDNSTPGFEANFDTPPLSMGIGAMPNDVELSLFFEGVIDEVRIGNYARSQSQIQTTMIDSLGTEYYTTIDSGLIGYWRFDGDASDLSFNKNNGTLKGNAEFIDNKSVFK